MSWNSGSWAPVCQTENGGGEEPTGSVWVPILDWGTLYDPNTRCTAVSSDPVTGETTFEMAGDSVPYDGSNDPAPRLPKNFSDIPELAGFDPAIEDLEVYVETIRLPTQTTPPQYGIGILLSDRNDVPNQEGIGVALRPATATTQTLQIVGPSTALGSGQNVFQPVVGFRSLITFVQSASRNWIPFAVAKCDDGNIESLGPSNLGVGSQMQTTTSNWQLQLAVLHTGSVSGTPTIKARVHFRRITRVGQFPTVAPAAKPTGGNFIAVFIGDSSILGWTSDQSPPDGEAGEAIDSAISLYLNGVLQTHWPYTVNGSPNPGYIEAFARTALANGFSSVTIFLRAGNGRELSNMMSLDLLEVRRDLATNGVSPGDVCAVGIGIGTNNSDNGTKAAAFAGLWPVALTGIERAFYNARTVMFEPPVTTTLRPHIATVNAAIAASATASTRRRVVPGTGHATTDGYHPTPATYDTDGEQCYYEWDATD